MSGLAQTLQKLNQIKIGLARAGIISSQSLTRVQNLQILNQLYRQSGGGVNLQQYLAIYEHLEGMKASDYPCTQEELIKIESRLREQLGNLVVDCALATTVEEQIQILRNYLEARSDRELLSLLKGRYQYLKLNIPLKGQMVTIEITTRNADGTVSSEVLVRQGSNVQTLESFMVANHIASVPALLALSTKYEMIDPESNEINYELSDLGYYKITNLIKGHFIQRIDSILNLNDNSIKLKDVKFVVNEFFDLCLHLKENLGPIEEAINRRLQIDLHSFSKTEIRMLLSAIRGSFMAITNLPVHSIEIIDNYIQWGRSGGSGGADVDIATHELFVEYKDVQAGTIDSKFEGQLRDLKRKLTSIFQSDTTFTNPQKIRLVYDGLSSHSKGNGMTFSSLYFNENGELNKIGIETEILRLVKKRLESDWMNSLPNSNFNSLSCVILYQHNGQQYYIVVELKYESGLWSLINENTRTGEIN